LFSIIISLILIGVLVIVHEFGHFIAAKKSGILVEEFSIGMGTKIFSRQKGETEYSIRLLPLGGFCRMQGEGEDGTVGPRSFLNKSIGVRFIVMAAGSFMDLHRKLKGVYLRRIWRGAIVPLYLIPFGIVTTRC